MASVRGLLNIQSLNELTYEKPKTCKFHKRPQVKTSLVEFGCLLFLYSLEPQHPKIERWEVPRSSLISLTLSGLYICPCKERILRRMHHRSSADCVVPHRPQCSQ